MALDDLAWYVDSVNYSAVTAWVAATVEVAGNAIRQSAAPAVGSERVFICIHSAGGTAQTAGAEPAWTTTRGGKTTDNTNIQWQEASGIPALNGDLTNTPTWSQVKTFTSSTVVAGQVCKSGDNTKILICATGGTMTAAEPTWAAYTTAGATTADNAATWVTIGVITGGASPYGVWANPHARIGNAIAVNWGQAGNTFYVASSHAATQTAAIAWQYPVTSLSNICKILCTAKTSAPPVAGDLTTGATESATGGGWSDTNTSGNQGTYIYGITIKVGNNNATAQSMTFGSSSGNIIHYDHCTFTMNHSGAGVFNWCNSASINLNNFRWDFCTWNLAANATPGGPFQSDNGSSVRDNKFIMQGGTIVKGNTGPTGALFGGTNIAPTEMVLRGVDMTGVTTLSAIVAGHPDNGKIWILDCGLPTGVTRQQNFTSHATIAETYVGRSDSTLTDYNHEFYNTYGGQVIETTIVLTGGASDGTTGISWKITTGLPGFDNTVPNAVAFRCMPLLTWNSATGQDITMTAHGIIKGAIPQNSDIDIECEYLGNTGSPLASFVNSNRANILAASAALAADTGAAWGASATAYQTSHTYGTFTGVILAGNASPQQLWFMFSHSGSGISGNNSAIFNNIADGAQVTDNAGANQIVWQALSRFQMSVTLTAPQVQTTGVIYTRVRGWLSGTTWYFDPQIVKSPAN